MASTPYIPAIDADFEAWLLNFSTLLTATPAAFGLAAADATAVAAQYTAWHAAFLIVSNPATKTKTTVAAKDNAKTLALALVRPYAQQISNNLGVSDANKLAIGVKVKDGTKTPINPPNSFPILSIVQATNLHHTLRYTDQFAPATSRKKPTGVASLEVHCIASTTIPAGPDAIPYYGTVTRQPADIVFAHADEGKQAYYAARWLNAKGEPGPWSGIINFTVAGSN